VRRATALVLLLVVSALAACGGAGKSSPSSVTVTQTQTVTAPATTQGAQLRKPVGHETLALQGKVTDIQADARTGAAKSFVLHPDTGGAALRVGVADGLNLNLDARETLLGQACANKVLGSFKVEGAPGNPGFDWSLLDAGVISDRCH
jgi:ABC-type glycerol-3-phosphate transport system substrate-binding protein